MSEDWCGPELIDRVHTAKTGKIVEAFSVVAVECLVEFEGLSAGELRVAAGRVTIPS